MIVDYIGVFRNLEKALAIYGAANVEAWVDSPIQNVEALGSSWVWLSTRSLSCVPPVMWMSWR